MENSSDTQNKSTSVQADVSTALVAGGCFWCVEADLKKLPGVIAAQSGYAGGETEYPTYEDYAAGGHREVVEVQYDKSQLSFRELLVYVLKHIDPTDGDGSFGDRGASYAPALYYETAAEKETIEKVLKEIESLGVFTKPLAVSVSERPQFWPAENYHQDYNQGASALHYRMYRSASGRDRFIKKHWGDEVS